MQVLTSLEQPPFPGPCVVAMGNFDGVHLGHRAILERSAAAATRLGLPLCVLTFDPHPLRILAPERAPAMIQTLADRIETLRATGLADALVVLPFTREFASIEADDFVRDWLGARLRCTALFVGGDARFGRDRAGDVDLLRAWSQRGAFAFEVVPPVEADGVRVSSSRVRRRVEAGEVEGAALLLGRPFSLAGEVVTGAGRGRTLGFPTANVVPEGELWPAHGVYAVRADVPGGPFPGAAHVGPLPTFGVPRPALEVHVIGFSGDLLGLRVRVHFLQRLRGVVRFADAEALIRQVRLDVEAAREAATRR